MPNKGSANHRELDKGFYMSFNNPQIGCIYILGLSRSPVVATQIEVESSFSIKPVFVYSAYQNQYKSVTPLQGALIGLTPATELIIKLRNR